jgi:hypothetical protein
VNTIGATTTANGTPVTAVFDTTEYSAGIKITDKQMQQLADDGTLTRHDWHPEWNYALKPRHAHLIDSRALRDRDALIVLDHAQDTGRPGHLLSEELRFNRSR